MERPRLFAPVAVLLSLPGFMKNTTCRFCIRFVLVVAAGIVVAEPTLLTGASSNTDTKVAGSTFRVEINGSFTPVGRYPGAHMYVRFATERDDAPPTAPTDSSPRAGSERQIASAAFVIELTRNSTERFELPFILLDGDARTVSLVAPEDVPPKPAVGEVNHRTWFQFRQTKNNGGPMILQWSPRPIVILGPYVATDGEFSVRYLIEGRQGNTGEWVELAGMVVNSHSSAFDLSVFGFEPQPIPAEAQ